MKGFVGLYNLLCTHFYLFFQHSHSLTSCSYESRKINSHTSMGLNSINMWYKNTFIITEAHITDNRKNLLEHISYNLIFCMIYMHISSGTHYQCRQGKYQENNTSDDCNCSDRYSSGYYTSTNNSKTCT